MRRDELGLVLPAGPGAASGQVYLNAERAVAAADRGEQVLLVRVETSPEDLRGMIAAEGILTARGGVSSHAALVARQMGKVCVCGASALDVDYQKRTVSVDGKTFNYRTNERLHKALELKLFEDQKDSIKLKNLVSSVVDKETQEKIDLVKDRLMKNYGYCEICSTDVLNFVASIFARGDAKE